MSKIKLDVSRLSDDDLQDMFTESYEKFASMNEISSFECICRRGGNSQDIKIEVLVVGMAGSPTIQDYKNMKLNGCDKITISREDRGSLTFKLIPEETVAINTNDYMVIYKAI